MTEREVVAHLRKTLEPFGATKVRLENGGRHRKIVFEIDGRERRYPFSTSLDDRGLQNTKASLRRLATTMQEGR